MQTDLEPVVQVIPCCWLAGRQEFSVSKTIKQQDGLVSWDHRGATGHAGVVYVTVLQL